LIEVAGPLAGNIRSARVRGHALAAVVVLLADHEQLLNPRGVRGVRVVNLLGVELLHLLLGDEAALMAVPLLSEILPTVVADSLLIVSLLFLKPVAKDFLEPRVLSALCAGGLAEVKILHTLRRWEKHVDVFSDI